MTYPPEFRSALKRVGGFLSAEKDVLVVSHHDADGITSCAVTVDFLRDAGVDTDRKSVV